MDEDDKIEREVEEILFGEDREDQYIDGIYNYCNRWCERCPFVHRCRTGAVSLVYEEHERETRKDEPAPKKREEETPVERHRRKKEKKPRMRMRAFSEGRQTPLVKKSHAYASELHPWIDREYEKLETLAKTMADEAAKTKSRERDLDAQALREALEVITFYLFFLHVKLARAASSLEFEREELPGLMAAARKADEEDRLLEANAFDEAQEEPSRFGPYDTDSNRTARVVLDGLADCIDAWRTVAELAPMHAARARKFQAKLSELQKLAKETYPDAYKLERPGFDDPRYKHLIEALARESPYRRRYTA